MATLLDNIMKDDGVHCFTKDIIKLGLQKDPVDAYYDCKLALRVLKNRMDFVLRNSSQSPNQAWAKGIEQG